jgi:hypothetical protein
MRPLPRVRRAGVPVDDDRERREDELMRAVIQVQHLGAARLFRCE